MPKKTTKTYATVNWSNMNTDAFNLMSNCQLATNVLASTEVALKNAKDLYKGESKERMKELTSKERNDRKSAKERADGLAIAFITRYISTADVLGGELYKFDMVEFLKNIGVLSDGEIDKKSLDKIENIRNLVVDRTKWDVAKRKNGTNYLTIPTDPKEIKNTPIELVLSIIFCALASGAIEYSEGGLAFKVFDK